MYERGGEVVGLGLTPASVISFPTCTKLDRSYPMCKQRGGYEMLRMGGLDPSLKRNIVYQNNAFMACYDKILGQDSSEI